MNGVEILNQYKDLTVVELIFVVLFAVAAVLLFLGTIYYFLFEEDKKAGFICSACFFVSLIVVVSILIKGKHVNVYQVSCSDEVSVNEFYEKYDVQKVEGKLYTVTEKETK